MKNLQEHRDYVYRYLDLDVTDVDVSLIDTWIAEGYRRIIQVIKRWPFFQAIETLSTESGRRAYPLPGELVDVRSIEAPWGMLEYMDYSTAQDKFHLYSGVVSTGTARAFSMWAGQLHIWPLPTASEQLTVVGYRKPSNWMAAGAGAVPDFPEEFEDALLAWTLYKAHSHQDDSELAAMALQDFQSRVDELVSHEVATPSAFPLVMGGGGGLKPSLLPRRLAFPWE